jgi:hypothetical protein
VSGASRDATRHHFSLVASLRFGLQRVNAVSYAYLIVSILVLAALAYAGVLRPTGLANRTRVQREEDRHRSIIAKWFKKRDPES